MSITLTSALKDVFLQGENKPLDRWMYAILYRNGKEVGRDWLPDGYEAEDGSEELAGFLGRGRRNPLMVLLPSGQGIPHPDQYGEYFKLTDGSLAQVFNRDRKRLRSGS